MDDIKINIEEVRADWFLARMERGAKIYLGAGKSKVDAVEQLKASFISYCGTCARYRSEYEQGRDICYSCGRGLKE